MPFDLSRTLVVGISSTALFDLSKADRLFRELHADDPGKAIERYRVYMQERENEPLAPGTGLPLVKALLQLNENTPEDEPPITEVVIMSRNSPETGVRVLNSIRDHNLSISRSAFTAGAPVTDYLDAFAVDLFLTTSEEDAQTVINTGACAAAVLSVPPDRTPIATDGKVRIALDGDAVIFSDESEVVYKHEGLGRFHQREEALEDQPLPGGPYQNFLKALARMQSRLPTRIEYSPVRLALVTSRNSPADLRVIKTLRAWGVYVDLAFFLGGVDKGPVLEAFNPHIFFDDQDVHVDAAAKWVPTGKVLYHSDSKLRALQQDRTDENGSS